MKPLCGFVLAVLAWAAPTSDLSWQSDGPSVSLTKGEARHWTIDTLPIPDDVVLEVSALAVWQVTRILIATRRGEVFLVDGALDGTPMDATFKKVMTGLQEPLGFLVEDDANVLVVQRGELSRLTDVDHDDHFESLETVCDDWRVGGNYHEYNFGPVRDGDGDLWITTNRAFGDTPFGAHNWRGFALRITADGTMIPECSGLRSPAGVQTSPWGDVFYTDNQGEWCNASKLSQLIPGSFHGHPYGIASTREELWKYDEVKPPPNHVLMADAAQRSPHFQLPAVWFPYDKVGRSPAGFAWDTTGGKFGPFEGHLFVTDQYGAEVVRVSLEQVNGHWQGAVYPFRKGLACGAIRCEFAPDGSLLVGETDRGWASKGYQTYGLDRIAYSGTLPAELHTMSATPDGFELRYTVPVDRERAQDPERYHLESYTYLHQSDYGSPEVEKRTLTITSCAVSEDGRTVRLVVDGLRTTFVHELHLDEQRTAEGAALLHDRAYYTLIERPAAKD